MVWVTPQMVYMTPPLERINWNAVIPFSWCNFSLASLIFPEVVECEGLDVFGQTPLKKQVECVCPHCQRNLAANRFAPHLEKCMGMGRNSSRLASRRSAICCLFSFSQIHDMYHSLCKVIYFHA